MSTDIPPSGGNNSDHLEEQAMEIEAMQAVFMDELWDPFEILIL